MTISLNRALRNITVTALFAVLPVAASLADTPPSPLPPRPRRSRPALAKRLRPLAR